MEWVNETLLAHADPDHSSPVSSPVLFAIQIGCFRLCVSLRDLTGDRRISLL
jgi:hypothetical protein